MKEALEREYLEFLYAQSLGSRKRWAYVDHLRTALSLTEEQARVGQEEVYEEFGKSADPSDWDIFLHGTQEQVKNLQDAIAFEMDGDPGQFEKTRSESRDHAVSHEQPTRLGKKDANENRRKDSTSNESVGDRHESGLSRNNPHDVGNVDGEGQVAFSGQTVEHNHDGGEGEVDPATLAQAICRAVTEPIVKVFEMSEPDGFCWIGMSIERLAALVRSRTAAPANMKVPVLLVLFDGRRIELNEELPIQVQVNHQQIKVTLVDSKVMAIKVSRAKLPPEDTLETLGNAVRSAECADSEIFIHVSVHKDRFEVAGWITGSEAKAYRAPQISVNPAAA